MREQLIDQRAKMINRLLLISLFFGSISSSYASDVTTYLQERAQEFVYSQLDVPLDARAEVTPATLDERLRRSAHYQLTSKNGNSPQYNSLP